MYKYDIGGVKGMTFNEAYSCAFNELIRQGKQTSPRGEKVRELTPYVLVLSNPRDRLLSFKEMRNIKRYCYGEALWYLSGSNSLDFISKYSSFWRHISDDGVTCNSAYGKYIFSDTYDYAGEKVSQWDWCKCLLRIDKDTRQAVIHIKPIQICNTKDTVCTLMMHFMIRNNRLNLIVNMRSNDIFKGLTFDVFQFTLLQELMAAELGVELGTYTHIDNNLHVYENDIPKIRQMLDSGTVEPELLPLIPKDFRRGDLMYLLADNCHESLSEFSKEFWKYGH